jgi:hypothetical protein
MVVDRDVSDSPYYWGGYDHTKTYVLENDVFIMKEDHHGLVLVPPGSFTKSGRRLGRHYSAPYSIEEFKANPEAAATKSLQNFGQNGSYKINVAGILSKGTKLQLTKLTLKKGFSPFYGFVSSLKPIATILDGPYKNTEVDITDVSIYYRSSREKLSKYTPEQYLIAPVTP